MAMEPRHPTLFISVMMCMLLLLSAAIALTGDGLVVLVDAARFLPCDVTVSKVVCSVWSSRGKKLESSFEGVCMPDSDAFSPRFAARATLGLSHSKWEDCTATLVLQVCAGCCLVVGMEGWSMASVDLSTMAWCSLPQVRQGWGLGERAL